MFRGWTLLIRCGVLALVVAPTVAGYDASALMSRPVVVPAPKLDPYRIPSSVLGTTVFGARTPAPSKKLIALTFDDGPWPGQTDRVLEILAEHKVEATFFWVGRQLDRNRAVARRVVRAGHAFGNHTWNHTYKVLPPDVLAQEIDATEDLIERVTGRRTNLFRPPGGILGNGLAEYAKQRGYAVVLWSVASADSVQKQGADSIRRNVVSAARPGSIVLLHDGGGSRPATLAALPGIIQELRAKGYEFVTVPRLLRAAAQAP